MRPGSHTETYQRRIKTLKTKQWNSERNEGSKSSRKTVADYMKIKQSATWQEIQTFGKIPILPTSPVSTTTLCGHIEVPTATEDRYKNNNSSQARLQVQ
jgi:hypothetical protein